MMLLPSSAKKASSAPALRGKCGKSYSHSFRLSGPTISSRLLPRSAIRMLRPSVGDLAGRRVPYGSL